MDVSCGTFSHVIQVWKGVLLALQNTLAILSPLGTETEFWDDKDSDVDCDIDDNHDSTSVQPPAPFPTEIASPATVIHLCGVLLPLFLPSKLCIAYLIGQFHGF